jgi:MFS family permease
VHNELSILKDGVLLKKRGFLANVIIFFAFFASYAIFSSYIIQHSMSAYGNFQIVQAAFGFTIAISSLLASFFFRRINKLYAIYACFISISLVTVLLFFISNNIFTLVSVFAVGIFFGIGQLAFSVFFWNLTVPEERGRIGGFVGFVSLPFYFISIVSAETLDFLGTVVLSGSILSLSALVVILLRPTKARLTAKNEERESFPEKRTILLYTIPWVMFSLINVTLAKNISFNALQQVSTSFYLFLTFLQIIATLFGTLGGGIIADFFGRRLSLAFAVTAYGISSALGGLIQNNAIFCFAYFANGLSWGVLLTLYSLVVWGDLSNKENCAKMYSIGLAIYYSTLGIGFLPIQVSQIPLVISALASCLLIFLSNVPILLAPELLSSDFRDKIRLRLHMRAVMKIGKKSQNQG